MVIAEDEAIIRLDLRETLEEEGYEVVGETGRGDQAVDLVRELRPDLAILAAAGRGNVDGEPIQGSLAQFVAREATLLRPGRVVLSHHDDWLPGFTSGDLDVTPVRAELGRAVPATELLELGYTSATPVLADLPAR